MPLQIQSITVLEFFSIVIFFTCSFCLSDINNASLDSAQLNFYDKRLKKMWIFRKQYFDVWSPYDKGSTILGKINIFLFTFTKIRNDLDPLHYMACMAKCWTSIWWSLSKDEQISTIIYYVWYIMLPCLTTIHLLMVVFGMLHYCITPNNVNHTLHNTIEVVPLFQPWVPLLNSLLSFPQCLAFG